MAVLLQLEQVYTGAHKRLETGELSTTLWNLNAMVVCTRIGTTKGNQTRVIGVRAEDFHGGADEIEAVIEQGKALEVAGKVGLHQTVGIIAHLTVPGAIAIGRGPRRVLEVAGAAAEVKGAVKNGAQDLIVHEKGSWILRDVGLHKISHVRSAPAGGHRGNKPDELGRVVKEYFV